MDKVSTFLQQEKGLDLKEHMVEIEEMVQLNNGGYRQVKSIRLSRTACVAIALNADQKKPIVKAAKEYFTSKNPFGADYFEELLDRIREIRTSERRYYQKITDIYAECSSDYDKDSEITRTFYKTVQNMMHYAVTHQTAAEIVYDRADAEKPHMGLMTWKNAPDGRFG